MTDTTLAQQLREHMEIHETGGGSWYETPEVCLEAADEIDRLTAELAEARQRGERLRTAHEVMAKAITDAIHENDQPHRIIFKDGFVIEGRVAEEWHRLLRLLQRFSRAALASKGE